MFCCIYHLSSVHSGCPQPVARACGVSTTVIKYSVLTYNFCEKSCNWQVNPLTLTHTDTQSSSAAKISRSKFNSVNFSNNTHFLPEKSTNCEYANVLLHRRSPLFCRSGKSIYCWSLFCMYVQCRLQVSTLHSRWLHVGPELAFSWLHSQCIRHFGY